MNIGITETKQVDLILNNFEPSTIKGQQISEQNIIKIHFNDFLINAKRCQNKESIKLIKKAFKFANNALNGMKNSYGEFLIIHSIKVAKILTSQIGLGTKSVVAAFMHKVVEVTEFTIEDIQRIFGKKICHIVRGVLKIDDKSNYEKSLQADIFREVLLTLSEDIRVVFIKLADQLQKMRILRIFSSDIQFKIVGETQYVFAPLAHRLGLYNIKSELEDLSLKYKNPKVYIELYEKIKLSEKQNKKEIQEFIKPINKFLKIKNFDFEINGRLKSIYSIWNKMNKKKIPFEEVYDVYAIRIILKSNSQNTEKEDCWRIYSTITQLYQPKKDRLRDWISSPKSNGYEALHTTVMGKHGKWVEVQIRSQRMDEIAEIGFAAHWKYKGLGDKKTELDSWVKKIKNKLEQNESDTLEFLDDFKLNLFTSEIITFTPKGEIIKLPKKSTVLDFAFKIDKNLGKYCIGAKKNYNIVNLDSTLHSGDQVEILTSKKQKILPKWLRFVVTAKAKESIKTILGKEREKDIKKGEKIVNSAVNQIKNSSFKDSLNELLIFYKLNNKDDLFYKIAHDNISVESIKKILKKRSQNPFIRYWQIKFGQEEKPMATKINKPIENGTTYLDHDLKKKCKTANCCKPMPGDKIIGYVDHKNLVYIHKTTCPNAIKLMATHSQSMINVKWISYKMLSFLVHLRITGIDNVGVVSKITNLLFKNYNINIKSIRFDTNHETFVGEIDLYIHSVRDLDKLVLSLKKLENITEVKRIGKLDGLVKSAN